MYKVHEKPIGVKFSQAQADNGANYDRRNEKRECVRSVKALVISKGKIKNPVSVRWYMAKSADGASPCYCEMWASDGVERYTNGAGSAGGYGYDKESAAFEDALREAGYTLDEAINGVGDTGIVRAINGVCRNLGYRGEVEIM